MDDLQFLVDYSKSVCHVFASWPVKECLNDPGFFQIDWALMGHPEFVIATNNEEISEEEMDQRWCIIEKFFAKEIALVRGEDFEHSQDVWERQCRCMQHLNEEYFTRWRSDTSLNPLERQLEYLSLMRLAILDCFVDFFEIHPLSVEPNIFNLISDMEGMIHTSNHPVSILQS